MTEKNKLLVVIGTRPEAIKMAPVILALQEVGSFDVLVCNTGQHLDMLNQVLEVFNIHPDFDLQLMAPGQSLHSFSARCLLGIEGVLKECKPDMVLVHGDTTTSMVAALAGFYSQIPVAHIEAGLRTYNLKEPWPEEANRQLTGTMASLHFAPTERSAKNLLEEKKSHNSIFITGNTVIDSLFWLKSKFQNDPKLKQSLDQRFSFLDPNRRLLLVTGHRRENFGMGIQALCDAISELSCRSDLQIVFPVHLNPKVKEPLTHRLGGLEHIFLLAPLSYVEFVYLMERCHLIITDSGGIQEEAPALGKPVLLTRSTTERPEAVDAGNVKLVGSDAHLIVSEVEKLLDYPFHYQKMARQSFVFGDGQASSRIKNNLIQYFEDRAGDGIDVPYPFDLSSSSGMGHTGFVG